MKVGGCEVHCENCMVPLEDWKKNCILKSYDGDECKLFNEFMEVVYDLESADKLTVYMIDQEIGKLFAKHVDIKSASETRDELISVLYDIGMLDEPF